MDRRKFLKHSALTGGAFVASLLGRGEVKGDSKTFKVSSSISNLKNPTAISMWDSTWLLRNQRLDYFEDWDKILDELCDRG